MSTPCEPPQDFWEAAEAFVDSVHGATDMAAIVCDERGIIRQAYDRSRIGQAHAGAQFILRGEMTEYTVTAEESALNPRVKPGCSCAIIADGAKVGTFGITGIPEVARPVARTASMLLSSLIRQFRQQVILRETARRVFGDIEGLTERAAAADGQLRSLSQSMAAAVKEASDRADASGAILETVSRIAHQSHLLSLNGSLEAARAGRHGLAFAVVVEEMRRLSKDTDDAVSSVQSTIAQIRDAIGNVGAAMRESSAMNQDSVRTMREIVPIMDRLRGSITKLEASFQDR